MSVELICIWKLVSTFTICFLLSGCSSKALQNEVDQLNSRNTNLTEDFQVLKDQHNDLAKQYLDLKSEKMELQSTLTELNNKPKGISTNEEYLKNRLRDESIIHETIVNRLMKSNELNKGTISKEVGIFDPATIENGDLVGSFITSKVDKESRGDAFKYTITFTGQLDIRAQVFLNDLGVGKYIILPEPEEMYKVPHVLNEYRSISILNTNEFERAMGEKLRELKPSDQSGINVTLRLKGFTYAFIPESHANNTTIFVQVLENNE